MKEEIKFKLGDRVYAPFHGYGVVTAIHEDACVYPIEVTWDDSGLKNMEDVSTFTADGLLSKYFANTDTILTVVKGSHKRNRRKEMSVSKYKVGDRVYLPYHYGTVTAIHDDGRLFPIEVTWDESIHGEKSVTIFAADGYSMAGAQDGVPELAVIERAPKEGEKEMKESTGFKLGDRVYAPYHGYGTVTAILSNTVYPIEVTWDIGWGAGAYTSTFTSDGHLSRFIDKDDTTLSVVKEGKGVKDNMEEELKVGDWVWLGPDEKGIITFIYPDRDTCTVDSEWDGEVEAVMAGLTKVEYSPINPSHYQVAGIPEAIDIMKHLMTQEQFKGFLWGNIIKYAYRYGRKGDEHDTAGKIEWYANRLKEVCAEEKKEMGRE